MLSAARRLAARPQATRALATAVAPKLDWGELSARVNSEEAKREVAKLKKTIEDIKESLAAQAKVRYVVAARQLPLQWAAQRAGCLHVHQP